MQKIQTENGNGVIYCLPNYQDTKTLITLEKYETTQSLIFPGFAFLEILGY